MAPYWWSLRYDRSASGSGTQSRLSGSAQAGVDAGRFKVDDIDLAVTMTAGALVCLGQLLHDQPGHNDAESSDHLAEDLPRVFGVPAKQAQRICSLPLPDPDTVRGNGSAA